MDAVDLLETIAGSVEAAGSDKAANRPPKLATIDPSYTSGDPKVTFDGESTLSTKQYPYLRSYIPTPSDRVLLTPIGTTYVIVGAVASSGSDATPTGVMQAFAGATAPTGWLMCDGAAVSRTTYARLYSVIGTTYGAGNGSTTFNVPLLEDRVPVGSGGTYARAATGGAATVTLATSEIPSHSHGTSAVTVGNESSHTHAGSALTVSTQVAHTHPLAGSTTSESSHTHSVANQGTRSDILAGGGTTVAATGSASSGAGSSHSHTLSGSTSTGGSHAHAITGNTSSGSSHTHALSGTTDTAGTGGAHQNMQPYLAVPYIIKY